MEINITVENMEGLVNSKSSRSNGTRDIDYSDYARFFDESNPNWTKDPEYNLMFVRQKLMYANDLLKNRGYVFLNEVYDMLGMPKSRAGQVVGWVYKEDNPNGDNYIDFGLYNENNSKGVNGFERTMLLDFNVDGWILDKI